MQILTADIEEQLAPTTDSAAARDALYAARYAEAQALFLEVLESSIYSYPVVEPPPAADKWERKVDKHLYLPVEVSARELPGKMWLAKNMPKDWQTIVGPAWNMKSFEAMPPGVVLFKTSNALDYAAIRQANDNGHLTVLLDEELFTTTPSKDHTHISSFPPALESFDLICAHTAAQAVVYRQLTKTPVEVTGNPRTLFPVMKRGTKVLVCAMAGNVNNYSRTFEEAMSDNVRVLGHREWAEGPHMQAWIKQELAMLPVLLHAAHNLIDAGHDVLVRPHPVEDPALYEGLPLDDRTPFIERLQDAKCVVFISGCGTGFEAAISGVPLVRLGEGGHGASSKLGIAATAETVCEGVEKAVPQFLDAPQVTLPQVLDDFQRKHAATWYFDLAKSMKVLPEFEPTDFMRNKFPEPPGEGEECGWQMVKI